MTSVYLADAILEERSAFRLLMQEMQMEVVGEAADWTTTLLQAPLHRYMDMLVVDRGLLPDSTCLALDTYRRVCPAVLVILLVSQLEASQPVALCCGADEFISKGETAERVIERLRLIAASVAINKKRLVDRENEEALD